MQEITASTTPNVNDSKPQNTSNKPVVWFGPLLILGSIFITILAAIALTLSILDGGFSLALILSTFVLTSSVIAGFAYIFRTFDELREKSWHALKPEHKFTLTGALLGMTLTAVGNAIDVPNIGFDHNNGAGAAANQVSNGIVSYLGNTGAWASIFNRYWADRPPWEKRIHRITIGLGIITGGMLVFFHYQLGYNFDQFLGIPGLDITMGPLGHIPGPSDILFIAGLTIVSTSFVSYSYRGIVHLFQFDNLMPKNPEIIKEYRDAKIGAGFGLAMALSIIIISVSTSLLPILPIPALIFTGITLVSSAGGIFSRVNKALRFYTNPHTLDDNDKNQRESEGCSPSSQSTKSSCTYQKLPNNGSTYAPKITYEDELEPTPTQPLIAPTTAPITMPPSLAETVTQTTEVNPTTLTASNSGNIGTENEPFSSQTQTPTN